MTARFFYSCRETAAKKSQPFRLYIGSNPLQGQSGSVGRTGFLIFGASSLISSHLSSLAASFIERSEPYLTMEYPSPDWGRGA